MMKKVYFKSQLIQAIVTEVSACRYAEIGVYRRENFEEIKAKQKIGIDPVYYMSPPANLFERILERLGIRKVLLKLWRRSQGEYFFEMQSSTFFKTADQWLKRNPIDVCFIDGLHTYTQALEDVLNTLKYLSPSGVIVMHDCCPTSAAMAYPAKSYKEFRKENLPDATKAWCGDVWKAIVYLRSQRSDLRVTVLNKSYGLAIITRGKPEKMLMYSKEEIDRMTYQNLEEDRVNLLNLQEYSSLNDLLKSITA